MNIIELSIIISLAFIVKSEDYQTVYLKDEMKVQSFSFSENQEYMVVNQHFYYARGIIFNLPHYIYKSGEKGYNLIGKQSYERAVPTNNMNNNVYHRGEGKIEINSKGTIFISIDNDYVIRIFQIKESKTHEIQKILPKDDKRVFGFFLSFDSNYIVIFSINMMSKNTMAAYKWNNGQFVQQFDIPSAITDPSNAKIGTQAQIILGISKQNQLAIYKRIQNNYQQNKAKIPKNIGDQNGVNGVSNLGKSQQKGFYTVFSLFTQTKQNKVSLQLRYLQLNSRSFQLTFKQSIPIQITNSYYLLTYLTKNGKYVMLYGKIKGKFQFINKFWNFTQGPSDIYVSQDGTFVAVANQFVPTKEEKFNKDAQQIAFFYKCNVANCLKCSWSRVCSQCHEEAIKTHNRCVNANNFQQISNLQNNQRFAQKSNQFKDYNNQLTALVFVVFMILAMVFFLICLFFYCTRKILAYCGYYYDFGLKKISSLNEEKITELGSTINNFDNKKKNQNKQFDQ